jgi:hypothetical protein
VGKHKYRTHHQIFVPKSPEKSFSFNLLRAFLAKILRVRQTRSHQQSRPTPHATPHRQDCVHHKAFLRFLKGLRMKAPRLAGDKFHIMEGVAGEEQSEVYLSHEVMELMNSRSTRQRGRLENILVIPKVPDTM